MRRAVVLAAAGGLLAGAVAAPGVAHADPVVPNPRQYVHSIAPQDFVYTIDVGGSTQKLKTEKHVGGKTAVTINSDVLFDFDKATLTTAADKTLDGLVPKLKKAKGTIRVDGYTDSRGAPAYNLRLSKRRAAAVRTYLAGKLGGTTIRAAGHGEADPIAPNSKGGKDDPEGRAKNRRVTLRY
jgi:outer membrane protein OmpA-like peptidoglycan-associated protein